MIPKRLSMIEEHIFHDKKISSKRLATTISPSLELLCHFILIYIIRVRVTCNACKFNSYRHNFILWSLSRFNQVHHLIVR